MVALMVALLVALTFTCVRTRTHISNIFEHINSHCVCRTLIHTDKLNVIYYIRVNSLC